MKRINQTAAVISACLLISGCSVSGSVENMLSPPKLTAEQNDIFEELTNSVGKNIKLKYPRNGEYRSAFVLANLDDEPGDEAVVFYETGDIRTGESALRMKFFDKTGDNWQAVYDLACPGSDVDSISFAELGGTGATNIILSCTLLNQHDKVLNVIRYKDGTPDTLLSSTYSGMQVTDLNKDDKKELIVVNVNKELQTASASMYTDGGDGLELVSNTPLYGGAADYIRITEGQLNENATALFLDYSKGTGVSGTDVLYCYGSRLFCPDSIGRNPAAGTVSRQVNDYMVEIYSFDIDGDGFVEIPSTTPFPGYETLTKPEQLCAVQWYTVENDNFTQKLYSYFSGRFRFALMFPNRWIGVVTAVADFSNKDIIFIAYNAEDGATVTEENELMRIHIVEKGDKSAAEITRGMTKLGENDDLMFYFKENDNYKVSDLLLTESELKDSFVLL